MSELFSPIDLGGGLRLPNRLIMAPCTRNRCQPDLSPPGDAIEHYAARAEAGLIVTEAVLICEEAQGYIDTPGLFQDSHRQAWARVVDAVHARGGRIFAQLWHTGRISHSWFTGTQPVAPSAVLDRVERRQQGVSGLFNELPRALSAVEIEALIERFETSARLALAAGFDGVEIHGANGYLIEQFLRLHTNRRLDPWGGDPASRARFGIEVVQACVGVFGSGRVGLRLSPSAYFGDLRWSPGDNEAYVALLQAIAPLRLAYVHTGISEDRTDPGLGMSANAFLRAHWPHALIANGGYSIDSAADALRRRQADMVSFGRLFLANPDLISKVQDGLLLRPYSPAVRLPPTHARPPAALRAGECRQ